MEITEVRIKLMDDPNDRLQGFCSITFDGCFVIRDLKIIQGTKGPFVAMPSRKLTDRCPECGSKNQLRAAFCNDCGAELDEDRAVKDDEGRAKLYADIAHPINSACRDLIQVKVLVAFDLEKVRAKQPGYKCSYDDYGEDRFATLKHTEEPHRRSPTRRTSDGRIVRIDQGETAADERPHHLDERPDSVKPDREAFGEGVV